MLSQWELAHGVRGPHRHGAPREGNMGRGQSWVNTGLPQDWGLRFPFLPVSRATYYLPP